MIIVKNTVLVRLVRNTEVTFTEYVRNRKKKLTSLKNESKFSGILSLKAEFYIVIIINKLLTTNSTIFIVHM